MCNVQKWSTCFPAVNTQPDFMSAIRDIGSETMQNTTADFLCHRRLDEDGVNTCSVAVLQVRIQVLKDMGITEYEPRVINQMLGFTYSEGFRAFCCC